MQSHQPVSFCLYGQNSNMLPKLQLKIHGSKTLASPQSEERCLDRVCLLHYHQQKNNLQVVNYCNYSFVALHYCNIMQQTNNYNNSRLFLNPSQSGLSTSPKLQERQALPRTDGMGILAHPWQRREEDEAVIQEVSAKNAANMFTHCQRLTV